MRRPSRQGQLVVYSGSFTAFIKAASANPFSFPLYARRIGVVLMFIAFPLLGQDMRVKLNTYFNAVEKGEQPSLQGVDLDVTSNNSDIFFEAIAPWLEDSSVAVRRQAYELVQLSASASGNKEIQTHGVEIIMSAVPEAPLTLKLFLLDLLTRFERNDFSGAARDTLRRLVLSEMHPNDRLIRLAGFVGLDGVAPHLSACSQPGTPSHIRWAALLALARMGLHDAIAEMMQRIKRFPVNDDVVYKLFPDLVYTRQPEPIAYMVQALYSNARHCHAADAEMQALIPCGYRIMEQLAPVIEGFPIALDESGDLATDDYPGALEHVRDWFSINTTYNIRNETY